MEGKAQQPPESKLNQSMNLGHPINTSVRPGSLGVTIQSYKGLGMKVKKVMENSQFFGTLYEEDFITMFNGHDLRQKTINDFKDLVNASKDVQIRTLQFRQNLNKRAELDYPILNQRDIYHGATVNVGVVGGLGQQQYQHQQHQHQFHQQGLPMQQGLHQQRLPMQQHFANGIVRPPYPPHTPAPYPLPPNTALPMNAVNSLSNSNNNNMLTNLYNSVTATNSSLATTAADIAAANHPMNAYGHARIYEQNDVGAGDSAIGSTNAHATMSYSQLILSAAAATNAANLSAATAPVATAPVATANTTHTITAYDPFANLVDGKFDPRHKCDICENSDGFHKMNMQRCKTCGVFVHEECYCLLNENIGKKYPDWECWACLCVGKSLSIKNKEGQIEQIKIAERPYQCALCPCKSKSGNHHAMHPLYDKSGICGQPLLNKDGSPVWVHTLCALFIGGYQPTGGLVYGCDENGKFESNNDSEGDDDDNDKNGNDNNNNASSSNVIKQAAYDFNYYDKQEEEEALIAAPHHFVITYKGDGTSDEIINFLKECRTELKCSICKNPDMHTRRIAVQCANPDCFVAFHIGCAQWSSNRKLVEFFPGNDNQDLFVEIYCNKHSKARAKRKKKRDSNYAQNKDAENVNEDDDVFYGDASSSDESTSSEMKEKSNEQNRKEKFSSGKTNVGKKYSVGNNTNKKEKKIKKNTKYYQKKRERESNIRRMYDDIKEAIQNARDKGQNEELAKNKIVRYWKLNMNLKEREFKEVHSQCEERFQQEKEKVSSGSADQKKATGVVAKKRREEERDSDEKDESIPYRWTKLWVPDYEEGAINFDDDHHCKTVIISESDVEKDDDESISF